MPKQKTHTGAKKRFKLKKSGLIKRNKMNRRHILTKKTPSRKRRLRKGTYGYQGKRGEGRINWDIGIYMFTLLNKIPFHEF